MVFDPRDNADPTHTEHLTAARGAEPRSACVESVSVPVNVMLNQLHGCSATWNNLFHAVEEPGMSPFRCGGRRVPGLKGGVGPEARMFRFYSFIWFQTYDSPLALLGPFFVCF